MGGEGFGYRLSQTRPIPRSLDGDKKNRFVDMNIQFKTLDSKKFKIHL